MLTAAALDLLSKYIDSAEQLDVVMLMYANPTEAWTADTLSASVFSVPQSIQRRLAELQERGLVQERSGYAGAFSLVVTDATQNGLDSLAAEYQRSRAEVVNAVFSMKRDPLKSFSNAFKFRS